MLVLRGPACVHEMTPKLEKSDAFAPGQRTGPFLRSERLLDSRDFRRVLRRGRRRADRDLILVSLPIDEKPKKNEDLEADPRPHSRLGITASRKVGNAVVRNQFKRRVRAWFRQRRHDFARDLELVVIARKSGAQFSLGEIDRSLSGLLGKELEGGFSSGARQ